MGCTQSLPDSHPRMFKARNLNDHDKSVNSVLIEVQSSKVIVHSRNKKVMASWPIGCIRRYGCNKQNILFIETGSGCDTGQGMYLFKCARTEQIFEMLKRFWEELQAESSNPMLQPMHFSSVPNQTVISTPNPNQEYYNTNNPGEDGPEAPKGQTEANYMNESVRIPSTSSSTTNHIPPRSPTTRGSTSSQHATPALACLPENTALQLSATERPFPLLPAPTCRQEMMKRRRINSDMPVASYNSSADRAAVSTSQRRNSENTNYENNDAIGSSTSGSFPRCHHVSYSKKAQQVKICTSSNVTPSPDESVSRVSATDANTLSPQVLETISQDISMVSLRSDCDPLLTPGSKSSGTGSLNGNGGSLNPPPPVPPPLSDPWKRRPHRFSKHRMSPSSRVPQSACEYVNTANASMDVAFTPLPATAVGGKHFSFDFDHLGFSRVSRSAGFDRKRLNYVPVEAFKSGDGDFNCGASSASSGVPGTPRSPKTPKTPLSSHHVTDYAIIDHNKTLALSNTHRARQRERKSIRHANAEIAVMNAV